MQDFRHLGGVARGMHFLKSVSVESWLGCLIFVFVPGKVCFLVGCCGTTTKIVGFASY